MSMTLTDRVAIVTGAGTGIGKAAALALARAGAHVAAVDIDAGLAKSTADAVSQLGRRGLAVETDVGDVAAIDAMVRRVIAAFERIDVLVNNAGVTRRAYIMDLTEADWDRIMRVNAKGVFFCLQRVAREMIPRRSGVIINIASIAGKGYAGTSNAIYAASKGGVISLTRTAAQQLAPHNINVNAVCPGTTVTALSEDNVATRARAKARAGAIAPAQLNEVEDRCIRAAVARQESLGLRAVTDGEYRRDFWHLDFMSQLDGVGTTAPVGMVFQADDVPPMAMITAKVRCSKPIMLDHFTFLKSVATATPKLTIPSPAMLHMRGGRNAVSSRAYPDLAEFWRDAAAAYRTAIGHLGAAGCSYLQLDDVSWAYLCDPKVRDNF